MFCPHGPNLPGTGLLQGEQIHVLSPGQESVKGLVGELVAEPAPSPAAFYLLPQSHPQPVQPRQQHLWPCQVLHIHSFGCHIGPQSAAGTGLDLAEEVMVPSMRAAASLHARTAAPINSLPLSWENTVPGGEQDFVEKHFHFFHSLQGTGEQVALTHLFSPKCTPLCLYPS